jgi:predicted O-methyltransferase YrrM
MNFLPQEIDDYSGAHSSAEEELLFRLNRETNIKVLQPRMLSGHLQGRILSMISHMVRPDFILEIGTYTGYSALCLAEGLNEGGKLVTIEIDPEVVEFADKFFQESKYSTQIHQEVGDAVEIIDNIDDEIDLVFIDADKGNYITYLEKIYPKLKMGGFIIADNVLWSGKVAYPASEKDRDTQILQKFNSIIQEDSRYENVLMPVRDGLMIARKVS